MSFSPRLQQLASLLALSQSDEEQIRATLLQSEQFALRPFQPDDYVQWMTLRRQSRDFLIPWEGVWDEEALSEKTYHAMLARYEYEASIIILQF